MKKNSYNFWTILVLVLTAYIGGDNASTVSPSSTTYNWGQYTRNSTFDWGQYTKTTPQPTTRKESNQTTETTTLTPPTKPTEKPEDHHPPNDQPRPYQCGAGSYQCAGTIGLCISLDKICDGHIDCPHVDDENPRICHFKRWRNSRKCKTFSKSNKFRGTGFQFHIGTIRIGHESRVKMFDQDSDNLHLPPKH
ncbi:low-density lipoprotein receptor-related protein 2-like protein 1 [Sarcoptes scabiei]|uniref:Low-density lipoprotein receptor-related protein 2-like protein 1 n=1 Tax=Sarcoptes scabiei TaxID=52283 RepID=A0A132A055_SARSC|nr:low-density lipoprotein receptor-related protein 2-like protein 1 [Sarcoptes scabiei]